MNLKWLRIFYHPYNVSVALSGGKRSSLDQPGDGRLQQDFDGSGTVPSWDRSDSEVFHVVCPSVSELSFDKYECVFKLGHTFFQLSVGLSKGLSPNELQSSYSVISYFVYVHFPEKNSSHCLISVQA